MSVIRVDWIVMEKSRYDPTTLEIYLAVFAQTPDLRKFFEDRKYVGFQILRNPGV